MKILRYALLMTAGLIITAAASAAPKMKKVYLYGFAASFNDSTVYFTNIHSVDSAWLASGTNFLMSRDNYAYQFRDYLQSKDFKNPTAVVVWSDNMKKAEKKYKKFLAKYQNPKKGARYIVKFVPLSDFKFKAITPYEVEKKEEAEQQEKENGKDNRPKGGPGRPGGAPMGGGAK